ncbi:hypothetical protein ACGF13_26150 [Kitasatospora sp. NPDC048286]|uniref:hypothetical protein n=1 Tax=Kitasatospora sp. NPDC048286 TaxID=3364047 RepID=UPI003718A109
MTVMRTGSGRVSRMVAAAGAVACVAALGLPGAAQAASVRADSFNWHCADESGWHYPESTFEVRTLLCLGERFGQLTPTLTWECKVNGNWGWAPASCDAKDMRFRLTDPNGQVFNGSMPDGTAYNKDNFGTPEVPCVVGDWKFEQSSTHRRYGDSPTWNPPGPWGDTSSTRTVHVSACT